MSVFSLDLRAHSEVGLVRKNNQDSAYASPTLLVICDGMGGAAAGDLASAVAITRIVDADARVDNEHMLTTITDAVHAANSDLADLVARDSSLEGMGTTVCGAMFSGTELGIAHIGDSRGYLLRAGTLTRLTHDHSWVQSLVDEGKLLEADAARHPHRSLLLRVLNGQPDNTPDTETVEVQLGDRVLFCSDGLCGMTTDTIMAACLEREDLDDAMKGLIEAAHEGGGTDNISMVLAEVVPQSDELDAREPILLGAARTTHIPAPGEDTATLPIADPDEDAERLRYLPTRRRRRWLPSLALLGSLVLAVIVASAAVWVYAQNQYYVGFTSTPNGDSVAVYRGIPDTLVGVNLSQLQETQPTLVADLPLYYQARVRSTISADTLDQARATAHQLSLLAAACIAERAQAEHQDHPSASASASHSASASASAHETSSAPRSPTSSPSSLPTIDSSAPAGSEDCS